MNFDRLRLVTELAGIGALKEAMLTTTMPERPGSFKQFLDIALDDPDLQITEFKYRCVASLYKLHSCAWAKDNARRPNSQAFKALQWPCVAPVSMYLAW